MLAGYIGVGMSPVRSRPRIWGHDGDLYRLLSFFFVLLFGSCLCIVLLGYCFRIFVYCILRLVRLFIMV